MNDFFRAAALVLLSVILIMVLKRQGSDMALLLSLLACCLVAVIAVGFLRPVWDFLQRLQALWGGDVKMLGILWKVVGISLTAEVASLLCSDAGNGALGKVLSLLSSCVILWLSIPILTSVLDLVERIMEGI